MPRRLEQAERLESAEASQEQERRLLELRKEIELECVKVYDKGLDENEDFFFIMDTKWLNRWADFVEGEESVPEPGPISTRELLDEHDHPLPFIQPKIDYRAICPMVYYIFREFHGTDDSPELCRYECDIHGVEVLEKDRVRVQGKFMLKASAQAKRLRQKWQKPLPIDEEDQRIDCCGCCWITKEHVEAFVYWMMLCCARRSDARRDIKYSQYQPLRSQRKKRPGRMKTFLRKLLGRKQEPAEEDVDDGRSVIDDDFSIGNAEEGHYDSGHWVRNMVLNNESVLK